MLVPWIGRTSAYVGPMSQMNISRIYCSLTRFSDEVMDLMPGSVSRASIREQIVCLRAMLLVEGQTRNRARGQLTSLVLEGELLSR